MIGLGKEALLFTRGLQQHGDPWRLSEELPLITARGHSTPPFNQA